MFASGLVGVRMACHIIHMSAVGSKTHYAVATDFNSESLCQCMYVHT